MNPAILAEIRRNIVDPDTPAVDWERLFHNDRLLEHPAFGLPEETRIGIPENASLRKDSTQIVFYGADLFDTWQYRLNSAQLVVLSLFDGRRTLREVEAELAELSDCNHAAAWMKVRRFLAWLDFPNSCYALANLTETPEVPTRVIKPFDYLIKNSMRSARLDKPVSLMLMPTNKCITDCKYCYACRRPVAKRSLLPLKRIIELIEEAAELGVISINVDGGDILARKEHLEILAHIHNSGMVAGISTKGYVSPQHAEKLYDAGVRWIQVGLDALEPMADQLVRRKGYFRRAVATIRNLAAAGINVRTNSIIVHESLADLPRLIDTLMALPLANIKIAPAFGSTYRGSEDMLLTSDDKDWFEGQIRAAEEKYAERRGEINWECRRDVLDIPREQAAERFANRPLCSSGRSQIVITPDGKVVTCEMSPQHGEYLVGDCRHQSIMEVWHSPELERWWNPPREKFAGHPCYDCEQFHECVTSVGHCWFKALTAYGTPYAPNPDCPKAAPPSRRWE